VIACRIWSAFCVAETSLAALKLGFKVYLIAGAHGTVADSEFEAEEVRAKQDVLLLQNQTKVMSTKSLNEFFS